MLIGPARDGTLLEVGVTQAIDHPGLLVPFHGMKVRPSSNHPRSEGDQDAKDSAGDC